MRERAILDNKFNRVKKVLVGLWRFKDPDKKNLLWAASWTYGGVFYDTYPQDSPEEALETVWKKWNEIKKRKRRSIEIVRG